MTRVLPAKVYDALQLSAAMYGGIGGGKPLEGCSSIGDAYRRENVASHAPVCYVGHLAHAGFEEAFNDRDEVAFNAFDICGLSDSDAAVEAINRHKGRRCRHTRVSFEEWCAELNVVRGPDEAEPRDGLQPSEATATPAVLVPSHD